MTFPKARLVVSAALFASWIAFLGYLVFTSSKVILSRPQFMIAQMYVVAEVREGNAEVVIDQVLWSARKVDAKLDKNLTLPEITACGKKQGNQGPGKYLLPLQRTSTGDFEIAPVPRALGFPSTPATHGTLEMIGLFSRRVQRRLPIATALEQQDELRAAGYVVFLTAEEIRIYPWNDGVRVQVEELIRAK